MTNHLSNPYDRRGRVERNHAGMEMSDISYANRGIGVPLGGVSYLGGLHVDDLHAVAASAASRGRAEAQHELREEHYRESFNGRRQAWDEGREIGVRVGNAELIDRIDKLYGDISRDVTELTAKTLMSFKEEPGKVTKQDLVHALNQAHALLQNLIAAHHHGFSDNLGKEEGDSLNESGQSASQTLPLKFEET